MKCPQCGSHYEPTHVGSIIYWQCHTCNSLWFDNQESQYVSLDEAQTIASDAPPARFLQKEYSCPRCSGSLQKSETGYQCERCGGQLTDSRRLVEAKQKSISGFRKSHQAFSFSQLKSSVIVSVVAVFLFVNYLIINSLKDRSTVQTEAASIVQNVRVENASKGKIAILFNTKNAYRSQMIISSTTGSTTYTVNDKPQFSHLLIITRPAIKTKLTIILTDKDGLRATTEQIYLP